MSGWAWLNHRSHLTPDLEVRDRGSKGFHTGKGLWKGHVSGKGSWHLEAENHPPPYQPARKQTPQAYNYKYMNSANKMNKHRRELWASDEIAAPADILISTMWDPEQRIQLSQAQTSDLEKPGDDKWMWFKPLTMWSLLCRNRKQWRDFFLFCSSWYITKT